MEPHLSKDFFINKFLRISSNDYDKLDEIIHSMERYISENEYDAQLELILHTFLTIKKAHVSSCFDQICGVASHVFELLKVIDWSLVELHVLTTVIGYTTCYKTSVDFTKEALDVLDDEFHDHKDCEKIKGRLYLNLSIKLLRARYYDEEDPRKIELLFGQCIDSAIPICEKYGKTTLKILLLVRKALFDGDCKKISEYLDILELQDNNAEIEMIKDDIVEFLHLLGDRITTPLLNFLIGHQIKKRRTELGMSTLDFADAIGTSQTVVNGFERGDKGVGGPRLCKISKVLNIDIAYFYGDVSKAQTNTVTDITVHTLSQLVSALPEDDKEYILDFTRNFIKHKNKAVQSRT